MKQHHYIAFSGFMWLFMGGILLYKGLQFMSVAAFDPHSLCARLPFGSAQNGATALMGLALLIGFLKGRFVLAKTVSRVIARLEGLSAPIRFQDAYAKSYWLLIGLMMALGMSFRFLPIPIEIRGIIDIAIGSALMNGALLFFRAARTA